VRISRGKTGAPAGKKKREDMKGGFLRRERRDHMEGKGERGRKAFPPRRRQKKRLGVDFTSNRFERSQSDRSGKEEEKIRSIKIFKREGNRLGGVTEEKKQIEFSGDACFRSSSKKEVTRGGNPSQGKERAKLQPPADELRKGHLLRAAGAVTIFQERRRKKRAH